jgi:hypothetical protein
MINLLPFFILTQLTTSSSAKTHSEQNQDIDVLKSVDLLIGSRAGGNVFAGATLPYGMAKGEGEQYRQ